MTENAVEVLPETTVAEVVEIVVREACLIIRVPGQEAETENVIEEIETEIDIPLAKIKMNLVSVLVVQLLVVAYKVT